MSSSDSIPAPPPPLAAARRNPRSSADRADRSGAHHEEVAIGIGWRGARGDWRVVDVEAVAEAEGGGWGCGGRIGIGEWGREGEMDGLGWIRSLGCREGS